MPEFYVTFARRMIKIPKFYITFARKMPELHITIARKIFSRFFFFWGGGRVSPAPVSYAYDSKTMWDVHLWVDIGHLAHCLLTG